MSKQDILRALGNADFMHGELGDSDSEGPKRLSCGQGYTVDDLFKKATKESNLGVVKVRSLGNALKDFQLVRCVDDDEQQLDRKVSRESFNKARLAMVDTKLNFSCCLFCFFWKFSIGLYLELYRPWSSVVVCFRN